MNQPPALNLSGNFDAQYGEATAMRLLFSKIVWDGLSHTCHRNISTSESLHLNELLPEDSTVIRSNRTKTSEDLLASVPGDQIIMLTWTMNCGLYIAAGARSSETSWDTANAIADRVPITKLEDDTVQLWTWLNTATGPECSSKTIKAPRWVDVERNYSAKTGASVAEIMKMNKPDSPGKIILWHGAPGTGKTSAIRTLMREWKDWCHFHYVSDPEQMFAHPSYLLKVAASDVKNQWRLVIAEDTDEFVKNRVKDAHGSMSRLLNFADGILGQGCNTLFLLTTNEKIDQLHPALIRPGRCIGQVEFSRFNKQETAEWLGTTQLDGSRTLAELFEHTRTCDKQITTGLGGRVGYKYL